MAQNNRNSDDPRHAIAKVQHPAPTIDKDREFLLASASVRARRKVPKKHKNHKTGHHAAHLHVTHSEISGPEEE